MKLPRAWSTSILLLALTLAYQANGLPWCRNALLKLTNKVHQLQTKRGIYINLLGLRLLQVRHRTTNRPIWVRLGELEHYHPVDFPIAALWEKVDERRRAVFSIRSATSLSEKEQSVLNGSSPVLTVFLSDGVYVVTDGNSRLMVLQENFSPEIMVEVNLAEVRDALVYELIHKVREESGLVSKWKESVALVPQD